MKLRRKVGTLLLASVSLMACDRSHSARAQPYRCDQSSYALCSQYGMCQECVAVVVDGTIDAVKNLIEEIINGANEGPSRKVDDEEPKPGPVAKSNDPNNR